MRLSLLSFLAFILFLMPVMASEPGQPLGDCDDWVILKPGITCTEVIRYPCPKDACQGNRVAFDNVGGFFYGDETAGDRFIVNRFDPTAPDSPEEILEIFTRTWEIIPGDWLTDTFYTPPRVSFDELSGSLYVAVQPSCDDPLSWPCPYGSNTRLLRFDSFPTRFEIRQTYDPQSGSWSFAVPARPEGLDGVDYFDTIYGTITNPIDFGSAEPLQCGYPTDQPGVGEYLTVVDSLPDPPENSGRYYLTVAHRGGERRYGRQRSNGVQRGRDPGVVSACE